MKAAQYTAPGQIDLVDIPIPDRADGQVLVRTEKVTICGSDLHFLQDSPVESYPWKPGQSGHECVGIVEESQFSALRRGDRMLVLPLQFNAFAEYVVEDPSQLIPLPEGLDPELGILGQQLGTVIYCCRKLTNVLDKVVVVVGQGPAGLLFSMLLYHMGARQVIGLDLVDTRLEVARQIGVAHALNVERVDVVEAIQDITAGAMADVVVEAVGKAETINLCVDLVRQRGEVAIFGVPKQDVLPIAMEKYLRQNVNIVTSAYAQKEPGLRSFRLALDLIAQERLDLSPLITHRLPFAKIRDAFHLAETKEDGAVKVLLEFNL